MNMGKGFDIHCKGGGWWLYLCGLGDCCILSVFLLGTLMMAAKATETCRRLLICYKAYFVAVHLLVYCVSVKEIQFFFRRFG